MQIEINDVLYSTAQMRKVEYLSNTPHDRRARITWADGSIETVEDWQSKIGKEVGRLVTAPPGFQLIRYGFAPPDATFGFAEMEPIIAFRIKGDDLYDIVPVPITGEERPDSDFAIVFPDGRCFEYEEEFFPDVETWKASVTARKTPPPLAAAN